MSHDKKLAIILDEELPSGFQANAAAVLALSVGRKFPEFIGEDITDSDNELHHGITNIPIPILKTSKQNIADLRKKSLLDDFQGVFVIDFCDVAQRTKTYADYQNLLATTPTNQLQYLGIAFSGPRKLINKLTGNLPLLR